MITGSTLEIVKKYRWAYTVKNMVNCVILTNNQAVRFDVNERRYAPFDVSQKYVKNYEYFKNLAEAMDGDDVPEAFYAYIMDHWNPNWNCRIMPETNTLIDSVNEHLNPFYNFIKFTFLKKGLGIDCGITELTKKYNSRMNENNKKNTIAVSRLLKEIGIQTTTSYKNPTKARKVVVNISFEELYNIFNKKKLIHVTDEILSPEERKKYEKDRNAGLAKAIENDDDEDEEIKICPHCKKSLVLPTDDTKILGLNEPESEPESEPEPTPTPEQKQPEPEIKPVQDEIDPELIKKNEMLHNFYIRAMESLSALEKMEKSGVRRRNLIVSIRESLSKYRRHGVQMLEIHVVRKNMTFEDAKYIAQTVSRANAKRFKNGGLIWSNLKYDIGWMCGRGATKLGEEVNLWTFDDNDDETQVKFKQDTFDELYFFIAPFPPYK